MGFVDFLLCGKRFEKRLKVAPLEFWLSSVNVGIFVSMIAYQNIYDSLADFMAALDPAKVLAFHAPAHIQARVEVLLEKSSRTA
ncbi:MAG: hypothetical protein IPL27_23030 [Lewinellaceae bacterium]|nr:hypothetical protein [Lewinellaceae bacterium]